MYYRKRKKLPTICPLFAQNHQKYTKEICIKRLVVTLNSNAL